MTLAVLGTMVWDRIDHPDGDTVERWGGITYSLAAAAAALPEGWTLRPIIKLGADLAHRGWAFLETVPGLERSSVREVPEPNNRVHLRYQDRHDREERLTGGVPGWSWDELAPHLEGADGLYVNLISGFELDAKAAGGLAAGYAGPRYVDIHSLVLGVAEDGRRVPRPPQQPDAWLSAFHVIQANEKELALLAGGTGALGLAEQAVQRGARAVVVTRGPDGARWLAPNDGPVWARDDTHPSGALESNASRNPEGHPNGAEDRTVQTGTVPLEEPWSTGDPTGCGDVWGATCFVHLMQGARLSYAVAAANRAAARNVDHRGADGLYQHLRTGH